MGERPKDSELELRDDSDARLRAGVPVASSRATVVAQSLDISTLPFVAGTSSQRMDRLRGIWKAIPFVADGLYARVLSATARYIGATDTYEAYEAADVHIDAIAEALVADGVLDAAEWQRERKREALRTIAERLELDPDHVASLLDELEAADASLGERLASALDDEHRATFPTDEDAGVVAAALAYCEGARRPPLAH